MDILQDQLWLNARNTSEDSLFARHSTANASPTLCTSSTSHELARPVAHGKQAAETPSKNFVPLHPFGPSDSCS